MKEHYTFSKYYLNELGEIYSTITNKILNPKVNKNGYRLVSVKSDQGKMITMNYARLLMQISQPKDDYTNLEVDHINRDKTDDRLENLRWVTKSENRMNRSYSKRPHRNSKFMIVLDNGATVLYSYQNKDFYEYPYMTIYTLANNKEGTNYSPKYKIKVYYYDDYFNMFNID